MPFKIHVKDGGVVKAVKAQDREKTSLRVNQCTLLSMEHSDSLLELHGCCLTKKVWGVLLPGFISNLYQDTSNTSDLICQFFCFGLCSISWLVVLRTCGAVYQVSVHEAEWDTAGLGFMIQLSFPTPYPYELTSQT